MFQECTIRSLIPEKRANSAKLNWYSYTRKCCQTGFNSSMCLGIPAKNFHSTNQYRHSLLTPVHDRPFLFSESLLWPIFAFNNDVTSCVLITSAPLNGLQIKFYTAVPRHFTAWKKYRMNSEKRLRKVLVRAKDDGVKWKRAVNCIPMAFNVEIAILRGIVDAAPAPTTTLCSYCCCCRYRCKRWTSDAVEIQQRGEDKRAWSVAVLCWCIGEEQQQQTVLTNVYRYTCASVWSLFTVYIYGEKVPLLVHIV